MRKKLLLAAAGAALVLASAPAMAQSQERVVEIYRAAPGKQIELVQYLAKVAESEKMAGLPACEFYAHREGASWDYMAVCPVLSEAQQKAADAAAAKMGLPTGPAGGIELRKYVAEHSDTWVDGPMAAGDLLKLLSR